MRGLDAGIVIDFCGRMVLNTRELWPKEPFQCGIIEELCAGQNKVWLEIPEGNAKTTLAAMIALAHGFFVDSCEVDVGAASRDQTNRFLTAARGIVNRTPGFRRFFVLQEGTRRIKCLRVAGEILCHAASEGTADGIEPSLIILDELHRHKNFGLYRTWNGKLDKRDAQSLTISTAGQLGGEYEEVKDELIKRCRAAGTVTRDAAHTVARSEGTVLHRYGLDRGEDIRDITLVKLANPLRAVTEAKLRRKLNEPDWSEAHWARMVCGVATRESGRGVEPHEWDALAEEGLVPDLSAWCVGWLDLGWKIDTTASGVLVWESRERRVVSAVRILTPPVDEADIVVNLLTLQADFPQLTGIVYDPNAGGQQMAQLLEKGEHPLQTDNDARARKGLPALDEPLPVLEFIEHSQDNAPMGLASRRFEEALRLQWIRHDGHRGLRRHVLNAVRRELGGEKFKYDRPVDAQGARRSNFPIDAFTGSLMGHSHAVAECDRTTKEPLVAWA